MRKDGIKCLKNNEGRDRIAEINDGSDSIAD